MDRSLNQDANVSAEVDSMDPNENAINKKLYESVQILQTELNNVNSKLNSILTDFNESSKSFNSSNQLKSSKASNKLDNKFNMTTISSSKTGDSELRERVFIRRNSLLTQMFKITHVRTIRHIFISIMIILALHVIFSDLMDKGKIDLNFGLVRWCFGNFSVVFYTWIYMKISTSCLVYFCFHHWSTNRLYYLALNLHEKLLSNKPKVTNQSQYELDQKIKKKPTPPRPLRHSLAHRLHHILNQFSHFTCSNHLSKQFTTRLSFDSHHGTNSNAHENDSFRPLKCPQSSPKRKIPNFPLGQQVK